MENWLFDGGLVVVANGGLHYNNTLITEGFLLIATWPSLKSVTEGLALGLKFSILLGLNPR